MQETIFELNQRLRALENRFSELGVDMKHLVQSEIKNKWNITPQADAMFGMHTALVVDTIDPLEQGRVRFYSPYMHHPDTPVKALPFANPISAFGGFDASGSIWVPPAGSTICIIFENGNRLTPFYIGTTWHRNRGADGQHNWGYNIKEFYDIHEGHRKGYLVGPNDGSQVLPPWNTESYNGYDQDTTVDVEPNPDAREEVTYPNICGFKSDQKLGMKIVNGDPKCGYKWKRMEIFSNGNFILMKDDPIHNSGQWAHTSCGASGEPTSCVDENGKPVEYSCEDDASNSSIQHGHPSTPRGTKYGLDSNKGSNPYYKHADECWPYKGPGTPQNNKAELPQTGTQILTRSGQSIILDDSVEEPRGDISWERNMMPFDFGCNNKFLGKIELKSATGHRIILDDQEERTNLRGTENGIKVLTASGNFIHLSDHTNQGTETGSCQAGRWRGVRVGSSSTHVLEMIDWGNEQCSPNRKEGGIPSAKADKAYIRLRSGYGGELLIADSNSQQKTERQYLQLMSPQRDTTCGKAMPHILRFQEDVNGGYVFLKAGGHYVCITEGLHITVVGDEEGCLGPKSMVVNVSQHTIYDTKEYHYHHADLHLLHAEKYSLILAGRDYLPPTSDTCQPGAWPVLCLTPKGITISDRIFVSASGAASCASIFQLMPFTKCPPIPSSC